MSSPVGLFNLLLATTTLVLLVSVVSGNLVTTYEDSTPNDGAIIFIPGLGGSRLQAKLNKRSQVHYACSMKADWYDMWVSVEQLAPIAFDCLVDNMLLVYNATSRQTQNNFGVSIRPSNYGSLDSVTYLDSSKLIGTDYYETIVASLEENLGFQRNIDMFGAPYDFRKAPNELNEFFQNLTNQIEAQYASHSNKPVTLICHSMGCLHSLYLLNNKSQQWRDQFIRRLVTLAAPWQGSFKAVSTMLFGDDLGIPLLFQFERTKLQALQSTFSSLAYLIPREPAFDPDAVLVETPHAKYTLKNLNRLLEVTQLLDQREMLQDVGPAFDHLKAPNVELWCLYGNIANSTTTKLKLDKPYEYFEYTEVKGPGDGSVNLESLRACESFASQQEKPVHAHEFPGLDHNGILRDRSVTDFIVNNILEMQ